MKYTRGEKVICNGYPGTIYTVCTGQLSRMYEVKVPGGLVCVDHSSIEKLPAKKEMKKC